MEIQKCRRRLLRRRSRLITIRITPEIRTWLIKNRLSPTRIFYEAISELGYDKRREE